jgi:hypothetical protein
MKTGGIRLAGAGAGAAAAAWLVLALPATAQQAGTIEIGAFARYVDFDNTLGLGNAVGVGGRAALYVEPRLALELDGTRVSADSRAYTPVHLRVVRYAPVGGRIEGLVGAGYVRNWYGAPSAAADQGLSVLLGLRYPVRDRLWLRLGVDLDAMLHTADNSRFSFYNGNWALQLGAGARLR